MDETQFWVIIEKVKSIDGDDGHARRLETELRSLADEDILIFGSILSKFESLADRGDIWAASNLALTRPCLDDCFLYFRRWLISRGREFYNETLERPDSLAGRTTLRTSQVAQFENFGYAVVAAFEVKTRKDYYKEYEAHFKQPHISTRNWRPEDYPSARFSSLLPKLWAKYGGEFQKNSEQIGAIKSEMLRNSVHVDGVGTISIGSVVKHASFGRGVVKVLTSTMPPVARVEFAGGEEPIVLTPEFITLDK